MKEGYRLGIVESNIEVANKIYEIKLSGKDGDFTGRPGQFYMVRAWNLMEPFLSRPISICDIEDGVMTFLYELVGKGTHIISQLKLGDSLELLGPLGNGFDTNLGGKLALLSGGVGMAPLIYLSKKLDADIDFYAGFSYQAYYIDRLKEYSRDIYISTEDGSMGHRGLITEIFKPEKYDAIFSCGPNPMMEAVWKMVKGRLPFYMSMEARMACGIGACLGCTIKTLKGMKKVCSDGPVFSGEEVVFND